MKVALEQVTVKFGKVLALEDVSAAFSPGEHTVITGDAASGKTTLLKLLAGLLPPTSGLVRWGQEPAATLSPEEKRARQAAFGMIFQSDALFDSMTVLENVKLPLNRRGVADAEALERALEVLEQVGLSDAASRSPEHLSGGMKKRCGIARAIVARPDVLLADDPFAGLDPDTEKTIARLLLQVAEGRTLVTVMADPSPALVLSRTLTLRAGRLV